MMGFKKVPLALLLSGSALFSHFAVAENSVFTVMDDPSKAKKPFEGDLNAGYLAQSGNSNNSSATANSNLTWYGNTTAWSLWGSGNNTSSNGERSSETYSLAGRSRYNLTDLNYVFGQASWLTDRYNGYQSRDVIAAGYGRQIFHEERESLRVEAGPGIRYDEYTQGGDKTQLLAYASGIYDWQFTDNAKFIQGVTVQGNQDATLNSETGLDVAINDKFDLKMAYNLTWNSNPPESAPSHTDRRTTITVGYKM